ncbi:MAG: type VI secretion system-associated protein TagF [Gammaproteobacteria bacterium HGW-Gammaproteobacteria-8]|nr:MAG: type VI secretion system-associated protein TagF [Gammaproteobacteria bacterium HGW-Gammaproteobacteria-8]
MSQTPDSGLNEAVSSGCYGKIPVLGDFVHRGLNRRQIEVWDEWLQGSMSASRQALGPRWLDYYLEAPIWYFAAGPGNLDQQTWIGVLIPSVDRVGRYFPFSIVREFSTGTPLDAMRKARQWYAAAEALALDCLDEGFEPGDLEPRLRALPQPESGISPPCADTVAANGASGRVFLLGESPSTNEVLGSIADDSLLQLYPGYSVWWTAGSSAVSPALLVASAMPDCEAFGSMLDGRFENYGWAGFRRIGAAPEDANDEFAGGSAA